MSTLSVGLGQPLLELVFHQVLQVLVSHTCLVIHVEGEFPPVIEAKFVGEWAIVRALLGAGR